MHACKLDCNIICFSNWSVALLVSDKVKLPILWNNDSRTLAMSMKFGVRLVNMRRLRSLKMGLSFSSVRD